MRTFGTLRHGRLKYTPTRSKRKQALHNDHGQVFKANATNKDVKDIAYTLKKRVLCSLGYLIRHPQVFAYQRRVSFYNLVPFHGVELSQRPTIKKDGIPPPKMDKWKLSHNNWNKLAQISHRTQNECYTFVHPLTTASNTHMLSSTSTNAYSLVPSRPSLVLAIRSRRQVCYTDVLQKTSTQKTNRIIEAQFHTLEREPTVTRAVAKTRKSRNMTN